MPTSPRASFASRILLTFSAAAFVPTHFALRRPLWLTLRCFADLDRIPPNPASHSPPRPS